MTLYESVLGDRFGALPVVLQRFHGRSDGRAHGVLRVVRGRGVVVRLAAWIMNMPPASERVGVELSIAVEGGREVWTRSFSIPGVARARPMITRQWREDGYLVEAVGPSQTYFELESEPEGMRFTQRRCKILGITVPRRLAPHVHARAWSRDADSWEVEVRISLPVFGLLVEYVGRLIPDP